MKARRIISAITRPTLATGLVVTATTMLWNGANAGPLEQGRIELAQRGSLYGQQQPDDGDQRRKKKNHDDSKGQRGNGGNSQQVPQQRGMGGDGPRGPRSGGSAQPFNANPPPSQPFPNARQRQPEAPPRVDRWRAPPSTPPQVERRQPEAPPRVDRWRAPPSTPPQVERRQPEAPPRVDRWRAPPSTPPQVERRQPEAPPRVERWRAPPSTPPQVERRRPEAPPRVDRWRDAPSTPPQAGPGYRQPPPPVVEDRRGVDREPTFRRPPPTVGGAEPPRRGSDDFFGRRRERAEDANRSPNPWRRQQREAERRDGFGNIDDLKRTRKERRLDGGRTVVEEPDARRIIRNGRRSFIIRDEDRRLRRFGRVDNTRRRPGGGNITEIVRPNGVRIFTETAPDGRLIRRYRRGRDGRIVYLVDNRRTWRKWGAIGVGAALATGLLLALDPPHYRIPRHRYIVEYDSSSYDDIYDALSAPPVEHIDGYYTLDHVLFNYNLRARMRRVDLDSINFDSGAWDIDESQYDKLEYLARAIARILERDPDEMFLIEGHTDAIGDEISNKSLSDRRAEEVASILTEEFDIPPENLVIQGYGEEFLKVDTDAPSRANRRVTVRRITPLLDRRSARYRD